MVENLTNANNMIPIELMTMLGGSVTGFLFRFIAERAKDRQEQFKMMIDKMKAYENSRDAAVKRVPLDAGKWVRRFIVLSILFGVILAPFIMGLLGNPIIVEVQEQHGFLRSLFTSGSSTKFVELQGYLLVPEVRQTLTAIIGFYFGQSAANNKS